MDNQVNSGSFASPSTGMQSGQGSALMRLMALRNQGASPMQANANTVNPQAVLPVAPVSSGSPINMQSMNQAQQQPMPQEQTQAPMQTYDPHGEALKIAMSALQNYIGSHGKALEAKHDVPRKTAEAKTISSQPQSYSM